MQEEPPFVRNVILSGDCGIWHLFDRIKTVWPDCVCVEPERIVYMDATVKAAWHEPFFPDDVSKSKDISVLRLSRTNFGDGGWIWIVSFHNCESKHVVPIVSAFMGK